MQAPETALVQALVAEAAIQAFDERVLNGLVLATRHSPRDRWERAYVAHARPAAVVPRRELTMRGQKQDVFILEPTLDLPVLLKCQDRG